MKDVAAGRVEKILVYKIDRISRNVHDFTGLCQQLSERGAEFPPGSPLTTARPVADVTLGIQNDASSHNTLDKLSKDSDVPRVYRIKLDVLKTHEERY